LDASNLSGVTSPFNSASFNDVLAGDTKPEISGLTNVTILTVVTFDGFTYTAKIGQKRGDDFPVAISIAANLPSERAAAIAEKPEEKTRLDKEFKDQETKLAEKLSHEKQFQNWIYYMPAFTLDQILKPKNQLLAEEKKDAPSPPENH
jgi:hypothetical protein